MLGVTAAAATLEQSLSLAYEALTRIKFDGMYYRRDIGPVVEEGLTCKIVLAAGSWAFPCRRILGAPYLAGARFPTTQRLLWLRVRLSLEQPV